MRQKVSGVDLLNRVLEQGSKFFALVFGDSCAPILDLDQPLADEDHLGDFGDTRYPGASRRAAGQVPASRAALPGTGPRWSSTRSRTQFHPFAQGRRYTR